MVIIAAHASVCGAGAGGEGGSGGEKEIQRNTETEEGVERE